MQYFVHDGIFPLQEPCFTLSDKRSAWCGVWPFEPDGVGSDFSSHLLCGLGPFA